MLLAQGLQQQGLAFHQGLERELATKVDKLWALEQELEAAKKLAKENKAARKTTKEQIAKMHEDFDWYHRQRCDERNKIVASTQRAADVYKELI